MEELVLSADAVLHNERRRQAIAVARRERARQKIEPADGLRVERARETEEAEGIVDLDAVHEDQVLIGRAPAYHDAASELGGRRHTWKRLDDSEHIVDAASDVFDVVREQVDPVRFETPRLGGRHDLHGLGKTEW